MKYLCINTGSSSLKYEILQDTGGNVDSLTTLLRGSVDGIGEPRQKMKQEDLSPGKDSESFKRNVQVSNHGDALKLMAQQLEKGAFKNFDVVAHRVVQGGKRFKKAVLIDADVVQEIEKLEQIAPLHNSVAVDAIRHSMKTFSNLPQVAVFDTTFHNTMEPTVYKYAIPDHVRDMNPDHPCQKYGFHGINYAHVWRQFRSNSPQLATDAKLIVLHLGRGCSVCAIHNGKSVDTSMGMTPVNGILMGSRAGDIDPYVLLQMMSENGQDQIEEILNSKCGMVAVCNDGDMREVERRMIEENDKRAKLAFDMFIDRAARYCGSYFVALGGCDAIAFTGGIGEHSYRVREAICNRLKCLGVTIDKKRNNDYRVDNGFQWIQMRQESEVTVCVVPAHETFQMALEAREVIQSKQGAQQPSSV